MATIKPNVKTENAHFLKGYASWLYCDNCNKTIAYLCYVTYRYFNFTFTCKCGCQGFVENTYDSVSLQALPAANLIQSSANNRYCCVNDDSALFSPVPKNLKSYSAVIVCKKCNTKYSIDEKY